MLVLAGSIEGGSEVDSGAVDVIDTAGCSCGGPVETHGATAVAEGRTSEGVNREPGSSENHEALATSLSAVVAFSVDTGSIVGAGGRLVDELASGAAAEVSATACGGAATVGVDQNHKDWPGAAGRCPS
jgi:hypothetical protein